VPELPATVPPDLVTTRRALHRVAERVVSPARAHATGRIGLLATPGGFGTPVFGDEAVQVRVDGVELTVHEAGTERRGPLTTTAGLARLVGPALLPAPDVDDELLRVDPAGAAFLAAWYAFGTDVLTELRAASDPRLEASEITLWPEHFDVAVELGSESTGRRAAYGASPGDGAHPEPYVYVAPWAAPEPGPLWQATAFPGAELPYAALARAADPHGEALSFLRARLDALTS
jgi:hypothetical protein